MKRRRRHPSTRQYMKTLATERDWERSLRPHMMDLLDEAFEDVAPLPRVDVRLRRVRLDQGGYDATGAYWGIGAPLYEYRAPDDPDDEGYEYIRARDRVDAKRKVREKIPGARFHR